MAHPLTVVIFGASGDLTWRKLIPSLFALAQKGVLDQKSVTYLVLNLVGSVILAVEAVIEWQLGFLLLETVWAIVSAISSLWLPDRMERPSASTSSSTATRAMYSGVLRKPV